MRTGVRPRFVGPTAATRVSRLLERAREAIAMDALLVSAVSGSDCCSSSMVSSAHMKIDAIGWFRRLRPRSVAAAVGVVVATSPRAGRSRARRRTGRRRGPGSFGALAGGPAWGGVGDRRGLVAASRRDQLGIGLADAFANVAEQPPARIRTDLRRLVADARVSGLGEAACASRIRVSDPLRRICSHPHSCPPSGSDPQPLGGARALAESTTAQAAPRGGSRSADPEPGLAGSLRRSRSFSCLRSVR